MSETAPVRFDVLHAYAEAHRLDFNELCRTVRDAIGDSPLQPLRELADEGATVMLSSWVVQGDVTGWRVIARGIDGWRKYGDGKTLEGAIAAAHSQDWSAPRVPLVESLEDF